MFKNGKCAGASPALLRPPSMLTKTVQPPSPHTSKRIVAATARIEGTTILVSSPEVTNPWSVRYAWDYNPDGNLINAAGLPASLFRTDENDDRVR